LFEGSLADGQFVVAESQKRESAGGHEADGFKKMRARTNRNSRNVKNYLWGRNEALEFCIGGKRNGLQPLTTALTRKPFAIEHDKQAKMLP